MTANKTDGNSADNNGEQNEKRPSIGRTAGIAIVVLVCLGLIIAAVYYLRPQPREGMSAQERQQLNEELGLALDFPCDKVPIYPGLEILETERGTAQSTEGEPMDKWFVHGQIDADKDIVHDFYHQHFMDLGMRQTQHVSIPTGYGMDYADEEMSVEAVVETRPGSDLLQVELTVYRLR
ncbi:hypothetical protein JW859_12750 [bacterium]|nr:hypothetical protein [bacterium]